MRLQYGLPIGIGLILFLISACQPVPKVQTAAMAEKAVIFGPENFTLVGFWKIEHKFIVDKEKSTDDNIAWTEVPIPREKYKEIKEGGENCLSQEEVQSEALQYTGSQITLIPSHAKLIPSLVESPSPAQPAGYVPGGACYLFKEKEENSTDAVGEILAVVGFKSEPGDIKYIPEEGMQIYNFNFEEGKLEIFLPFSEEGFKTILVPSTKEAAEADSWPYYNIT